MKTPAVKGNTDWRKVSVTFDGKSVSHLNEGIGPSHSDSIPAHMEDPILLEQSHLGSFQQVFYLWQSRNKPQKGRHPLDGVDFEAGVIRTSNADAILAMNQAIGGIWSANSPFEAR